MSPDYDFLSDENDALAADLHAAHIQRDRLRAENAALKKMIGEWAEEVENQCPHCDLAPCNSKYGVHSIAAKMREAVK